MLDRLTKAAFKRLDKKVSRLEKKKAKQGLTVEEQKRLDRLNELGQALRAVSKK